MLGDLVELADGVSPVAATFDHEALQLFADDQKSDLGNALMSGIRAIFATTASISSTSITFESNLSL